MSDAGSLYNSNHRAVLQTFLTRPSLSVNDILTVLRMLSHQQETNGQNSTADEHSARIVVEELNAAISTYDFEIRSCRSQIGGELLWSFVNTTSDPVTQLATSHTADEIAYVKRLLDEMFEKNNTVNREVMAITSIQALKMSRIGTTARDSLVMSDQDGSARAKDLSKADAERVLQNLVDEGWFTVYRGMYTLSERGLLELRNWLLETYNDPPEENSNGMTRIKLCQGCRDVVTIGQRCTDRHCLSRLHSHCATHLFRSQRNVKSCPICGKEWSGIDHVGPLAAT